MAAATKTALQLLEEELATYKAELITRSAAIDEANLTGDATKKQDAKEARDFAERMYNSLVAQIKDEKERLQGEFHQFSVYLNLILTPRSRKHGRLHGAQIRPHPGERNRFLPFLLEFSPLHLSG
jgi:hypothetical protein